MKDNICKGMNQGKLRLAKRVLALFLAVVMVFSVFYIGNTRSNRAKAEGEGGGSTSEGGTAGGEQPAEPQPTTETVTDEKYLSDQKALQGENLINSEPFEISAPAAVKFTLPSVPTEDAEGSEVQKGETYLDENLQPAGDVYTGTLTEISYSWSSAQNSISDPEPVEVKAGETVYLLKITKITNCSLKVPYAKGETTTEEPSEDAFYANSDLSKTPALPNPANQVVKTIAIREDTTSLLDKLTVSIDNPNKTMIVTDDPKVNYGEIRYAYTKDTDSQTEFQSLDDINNYVKDQKSHTNNLARDGVYKFRKARFTTDGQQIPGTEIQVDGQYERKFCIVNKVQIQYTDAVTGESQTLDLTMDGENSVQNVDPLGSIVVTYKEPGSDASKTGGVQITSTDEKKNTITENKIQPGEVKGSTQTYTVKVTIGTRQSDAVRFSVTYADPPVGEFSSVTAKEKPEDSAVELTGENAPQVYDSGTNSTTITVKVTPTPDSSKFAKNTITEISLADKDEKTGKIVSNTNEKLTKAEDQYSTEFSLTTDDLKDGAKKNFIIQAKNNYGNDITQEITLARDTTAPKIDNIQKTQAPSDPERDEKDTEEKFTKQKDLTVSFTASDLVPGGTDYNNFGDDAVEFSLNGSLYASTPDKKITRIDNDDETKDCQYRVVISSKDLKTYVQQDGSLRGQIVVRDANTKNETTEEFTLNFKDGITITETNPLLPENLNINEYDDRKSKIKNLLSYDFQSDWPINNLTYTNADQSQNLTIPNEVGTSSEQKIDFAGVQAGITNKGYDKDTEKYQYTVTIDLQEQDSAAFSFKLKATDGYGNSKETENKVVNIDYRKPFVNMMTQQSDDKWYSNVTLNVTYNDNGSTGKQADSREWQSGIKEITDIKGVTSADVTISQDGTITPEEKGGSFTLKVNPSKDLSGTKTSFTVTDKASNSTQWGQTYFVDAGTPKSAVTVDDETSYRYLNGDPKIAYTAEDGDPNGVSLRNCKVTVTKPDGTTREKTVVNFDGKTPVKSVASEKGLTLSGFLGTTPKDGVYSVRISASNLADVSAGDKTVRFMLDNIKPVVDITKVEGDAPKQGKYSKTYLSSETGTRFSYGQYYRGAVRVTVSAKDVNQDTLSISVTDNGREIATKEGTYTISGDGSHDIRINATDAAGNKAVERKVSFIIDTVAPSVAVALNGSAFQNGAATRYLNTNGAVDVWVSDANKDVSDLNRVVTMTRPSAAAEKTTDQVQEGTIGYTTDADYTVTYQAIDCAGNASPVQTVTFRVDKVAPELRISGLGDKATATSNAKIDISMTEAFYWDMNDATVTITSQPGDGKAKSQKETFTFKASNAQDVISRELSEDGIYTIQFNAEDKCGNKADTTYEITVDKTMPLIVLELTDLSKDKKEDNYNYYKSKKGVSLTIYVDEAFYSGNEVKVSGTRAYLKDGKLTDPAEKLKFKDISEASFRTGSRAAVTETFKDDGIYDLEITATDRAHKSADPSVKKIHFTVDKTKPQLNQLKKYDGTVRNSFDLSEDDENLYTDLTTCDVKLYLDGVEYDGNEKLEDGTHTVRLEATDELGNVADPVERTFLLDTQKPEILVNGVEKGGTYQDKVTITVTTQLNNDTLDSVTLNGKTYTTEKSRKSGTATDATMGDATTTDTSSADNTITITVDKPGKYQLTAKAHDAAGNVSEITDQDGFTFNFRAKFNWALLIGIVAGVIVVGGVLIILVKNRKKEN